MAAWAAKDRAERAYEAALQQAAQRAALQAESRRRADHGMTAAIREYNMKNRTTLLFFGTGLSLTLGSIPSTLQAQQPKPSLTPAQQQQIEKMLQQPKLELDPTKYPRYPINPMQFQHRPPG